MKNAVMAGITTTLHTFKQTLQRHPRSMELISVVTKKVWNESGDEVVGEEKSFQLNQGNLKHVMSQVELGMPVAIVSVVGAFRSGKSFLLSCFLESLGRNESDDTFKGGVLGGKAGRADGFSWKGGVEGHTQGMTVWSKPFIREVDDGEGGRTKMAVLLVDTQGTFDHKTNTHLEACLFGLSTTLSSCQIFNVRNQVQADNLGSLAVYLEYGTIAQETQNGGGQDSGRPFQRLEVLIRDWQNWKDITDPSSAPCEWLRQEFLGYLDGILGKATTDSAEKVKGCFRDRIGCFGLPNPGEYVASRSFDGDIDKINEGFRRLVTYYVRNVIFGKLRKTNVPSFSYRGSDEFVDTVKQIVQLFSNGLTNGMLPDAGSWLGTMQDAYNHDHMEEILDDFKRDMDEHTTAPLYRATLQGLLEEHKNSAMGRFRPRGDDTTKEKARQALLVHLNKEAVRMDARNSSRMTWYGQSIAIIVGFLTALSSAVSTVIANSFAGCFCAWEWIKEEVVEPWMGWTKGLGEETRKILRPFVTFLKLLGPALIILLVAIGAQIILVQFVTLKAALGSYTGYSSTTPV